MYYSGKFVLYTAFSYHNVWLEIDDKKETTFFWYICLNFNWSHQLVIYMKTIRYNNLIMITSIFIEKLFVHSASLSTVLLRLIKGIFLCSVTLIPFTNQKTSYTYVPFGISSKLHSNMGTRPDKESVSVSEALTYGATISVGKVAKKQ